MALKHRIILLIVSLIIVSAAAYGATGPVDTTTLSAVATRFLSSQTSATFSVQSTSIDTIQPLIDPSTGETVAFIAELAPEGYVVLGSDRSVQPVIAYSFSGSFPWGAVGEDLFVTMIARDISARRAAYTSLPPDIRVRIDEAWARYTGTSSAARSAATFRQWPQEGSTATGGWVTTSWGQLEPYNVFCPLDIVMDEPMRSPIGCVGTALAQIINYHRDIGGLRFGSQDAYESLFGPAATSSIFIDSDAGIADFATFEELNTYLAAIEATWQSSGDITTEQAAALSYAIAILAEADFSFSQGTGAADDYFFNNFIGKHGVAYSYSPKNPFEDDFYAVLKTNMMEGYPATLMVNKTYLCAVNHEVVCDGYNTDGFFHLNFGWYETEPDAMPDAWYLLPEGMGAGYDLIQFASMNIRPGAVPGDTLSVSPGGITVGSAFPGDYTPTSQTVISNPGGIAMPIASIATGSSHFEISLDGETFENELTGIVIPGGGSITLTVRCMPDSIGTFRGEAIITYGGETTHYLAVDFTALGIPDQGTIVEPGVVSGTWTKEGSPYLITGNIEVWSGGPLHMRPGTDVVFLGKFELTLQPGSSLYAIGAADDSIYFRPYNPTEGWYGITIVGTNDEPLNEHKQIFDYCVVTGGNATGRHPQNVGGAMRIVNSSPLIKHSSLSINTASGMGNALLIQSIFGETTTRAPRISNTLIANNASTSSLGGAIAISGTRNVVFENVTIVNNSSKNGGAISLNEGSSLHLINSIIWNNRILIGGKGRVFNLGSDIHYNSSSDSIYISYSVVDTTATDWFFDGEYPGVVVWGEGNIHGDPLFTDIDNLDFHLTTTSPCIDAGSPLAKYRDQGVGETAILPAMGTSRSDMGAYGGGGFLTPPSAVTEALIANGEESGHIIRWESPAPIDTITEYRIYRSLFSSITTIEPFPGFDDINVQIDAEFQHTYLVGTVTGETTEFSDPNLTPSYLNYFYWVSAVADGIESEKIPVTTVTAIEDDIPLTFSLNPAYPNPFNPSTIIEFTLPEAQHTTLVIYDVLGRQVTRLTEGRMAAGVHRMIWNGHDRDGAPVSSGVYFYRLSAGPFTGTGKMLLVR